jgi:hypothetical protein
MLKRGDDEVAIISPVKPRRAKRPGKALTLHDSLFGIIGKARIENADAVVDNVDNYLAEAKLAI